MSRFPYCVLSLMVIVFPVLVKSQSVISLNTVVIDAGHGGKDPGALGSKVKEKDVTLSVALKLGRYIRENFKDVNVIYTRDKDVFVELDERAKIANRQKADLFISIHANSISKPTISGTETFVLGLHRSQDNLEVAKKENSVIVLEENYTAKYEGFDPNSTESYIIFELMQNAYLDQSIQFASMVESQFSTRSGRESRGVKQAGFLVIRQTSMPSVLVELGYLTNKQEEAFLATDDGQSIMASAIFRAFREYKQNYDAKSNLVVNGNILPDSNPKPSSTKPDTKAMETKGKGSVNDHKDEAKPTESNHSPVNSTPTVQPILFRVQIATNVKPLPADKLPLSAFEKTWMYKDNGTYKYTTGETASFAEIKRVLGQARKTVPDAFIVAFDGDKRITLDEALAKLNQTRQ